MDHFKKLIILIVAFALCSSIVLSGCTNNSVEATVESTNSDNSEIATSIETSRNTLNTVSSSTSNSNSTDQRLEKDAWRMAYIEYIRGGDGEYSRDSYPNAWAEYTYFTLLDVDGDDVPELLRTGSYVAQGEALVTYADGKLKIINSYASEYFFQGNSGYLWREERDRENDIEYYRYFKYNKGDLTLLLEAAEIDETASRDHKFIWDGKEVTEEVFRSHLKEFKNNPKIYAESSDLDEMAFAISDF